MSGFRNALTKRYGEAGALSRGAKPKISSSSSGMIAEGSGANPNSDMVNHPISSGLTAPGLKAQPVQSKQTAPGLKATTPAIKGPSTPKRKLSDMGKKIRANY